MKFSFHNVGLCDIEGKPLADQKTYQKLGQAIYSFTKNLDLVDKAKVIYRGEDVELEKVEVDEVVSVINNPQIGFASFTKKAYLDYIADVRKKAEEKK